MIRPVWDMVGRQKDPTALNQDNFLTNGPDMRSWNNIKTEAMRAPGGDSPWLTLSRQAQGIKNLRAADQAAMQNAPSGNPQNEAAATQGLYGGIGAQAGMQSANAASDVGLQRGAEEQRQGWLTAAPGAWNKLQQNNVDNAVRMQKFGGIMNDKRLADFTRRQKEAAAHVLAVQEANK